LSTINQCSLIQRGNNGHLLIIQSFSFNKDSFSEMANCLIIYKNSMMIMYNNIQGYRLRRLRWKIVTIWIWYYVEFKM